MKKKYGIAIIVCTINSLVMAVSLSPQQSYPLMYNYKQYDVYEMSPNIGQLSDGSWVKLVCIKKGMIGMPNVSMASYRGKYTSKNGDTCYVFALEPDGEITFNNQSLKIYRVGNDAFLSDGTQVKIECLAPGAIAKIATTPAYRGTYFSGSDKNKQQCHVWVIEDTQKASPSTTGIGGIGTGFRP